MRRAIINAMPALFIGAVVVLFLVLVVRVTIDGFHDERSTHKSLTHSILQAAPAEVRGLGSTDAYLTLPTSILPGVNLLSVIVPGIQQPYVLVHCNSMGAP